MHREIQRRAATFMTEHGVIGTKLKTSQTPTGWVCEIVHVNDYGAITQKDQLATSKTARQMRRIVAVVDKQISAALEVIRQYVTNMQ